MLTNDTIKAIIVNHPPKNSNRMTEVMAEENKYGHDSVQGL